MQTRTIPSSRWDILVHGRSGRLQLGIEVKTVLNTSTAYVTEWKNNIFSHEESLDLPYFMMAFPDRFYLWKNPHEHPGSEPDFEINALPFILPYFERANIRMETVDEGTFELVVSSWLSQVLHFVSQTGDLPAVLRNSGLLEAIADGSYSFENVI